MNKYLIPIIFFISIIFAGCSSLHVESKEASFKKYPNKVSLTNTYWKLTVLNGKAITQTQHNKREAHIVLNQGKVKGNSGCNGLGGKYILNDNKLSFSDKGFFTTRMFCKGSRENEFLNALKNMHNYKITGEYLEIFDKDDVKLARFESVYLH